MKTYGDNFIIDSCFEGIRIVFVETLRRNYSGIFLSLFGFGGVCHVCVMRN